MPKYIVNGETYGIPEWKAEAFERKYPDAKIVYNDSGNTYQLPINKREGFLRKFPNAVAEEVEQMSPIQVSNSPLMSAQQPYYAPSGDYTQPTEAQRNYEQRGNFEPMGQGTVELGERDVPVLVGKDGQYRVPSPVKLDEQEELYRHGNPSEAEQREYADTQYRKVRDASVGKIDTLEKSISEKLNDAVKRGLENERDKWSMPFRGITGTPQAGAWMGNENNPDVVALRAAQNLVKDSKHQMETSMRRHDGFFTNTGRSALDAASDIRTWDFGFTDMKDSGALLNVVNKEEKGEKLTDAEQLLLDASVNNALIQAYYKAQSAGELAGATTVDMVPFMAQILVNPISGVGKAAGSAAAKAVAKYINKKIISKGLLGTFVKKALPRVTAVGVGAAGDVVGGTGVALTTNVMNTAADAYQRHLKGDTEGDAWRKAILGQGIEFASENTGRFFEPFFGGIGKALGKGAGWSLGKLGAGKVVNLAKDYAKKAYSPSVKEFFDNTQWNGFFGEYGEEIAGGLMNAAMVGDQTVQQVFSKDNLFDTAVGLSVASVLFPGVASVNYAATKYNQRNDALAAEKAAKAVFGDRWETFKAAIKGAENSNELGKAIAGVYESEGKKYNSSEETKALYDYAKSYFAYNALKEVNPESVIYRDDDYKELDDNVSVGRSLVGEELQAANLEANRLAEEVMRMTGVAADELESLSVEDVDARIDEAEANGDFEVAEVWRNFRKQEAKRWGAELTLRENIEEKSVASDAEVDAISMDGMIVPATLRGGEVVNIVGGNVSVDNNGVVDEEASDKQIVIVQNGERKVVGISSIGSLGSAMSAEEEKAKRRAVIEEQMRKEHRIATGQEHVFTPGETFETPNGEVQFIADRGDGTADITVNGVAGVYNVADLSDMYVAAQQMAYNAERNAENIQQTNTSASTGEGGSAENLQQGNDNKVVGEEKPSAPVDAIPMEKRGKEERAAYHMVPIARTLEDLHDGALEQQEIDGLIDARVKEAAKDLEDLQKKKPAIGADKNAYLKAKEQWQADVQNAQKVLDYYNELRAKEDEITKSEHAPITAPEDVAEIATADEYVAGLLGGIKITPESFRKETGLSKEEQKKMVGVIASEDKGGISIERASELIAENYGEELRGLGFTGDMMDIRDMLIDILSSGHPKTYAKRGKEQRVAEALEQERDAADSWASENFGFASYDDLIAYEETLIPNMIQKYAGFDEQTYFNTLAENYEYDTTRESERVGSGSEVLQGERSVPADGTESIGERNQGGAVQYDVQGGAETTDAQETLNPSDVTAKAANEMQPAEMDQVEDNLEKVTVDNQGNPMGVDGKLVVEEVANIDEITDEDFEIPTRNVQLPAIPENVANAIGTNGRPVVIKKNVFEKNGNTHVELEPEDSRNILRSALYNPNIVGSTQPIRRPDYKVAIRTGEQNAVVVLDVYHGKDFVEIVGWRMVNEKGLAKMQRQAEREGGQFLILSPNDGSAAALSALPLGLSSEGEDKNSISNSQENEQKSGENGNTGANEGVPESAENRSQGENLENDLGNDSQIEEARQYITYNELRTLFASLNKSEKLALLFERVLRIAETAEVKVYFGEDRVNIAGNYRAATNSIYLNKYFFDNNIYGGIEQKDSKKAHSIVHELIHAVTVYAVTPVYLQKLFPAIKRQEEYNKLLRSIPDNLKKAGESLYQLFYEVRDATSGRQARFNTNTAFSNPMEFIAELSNEEFKAQLKELNLWKRIVEGIKKFFRIAEGNTIETNVEKEADEILEEFISNFSIEGHRAFVEYDAYTSGASYQRGSLSLDTENPAFEAATKNTIDAVKKAGVEVVEATPEMVQAMSELAEMQKRTAPETASVQKEHQPTVVSSADKRKKSLETALQEDETSFKGTAISSDNGTKVLKNIDKAIEEYENKGNQTKTFIGDLANALDIDAKDKSSKYETFEAKNGKVFIIRISNHNATVSNFDNRGEGNGISIVVSRADNAGITNDGDAHLVEFFYSDKKLKTAEGKPLVEILKSIKQALYSGEYKDNTGLAQREEVNIPEFHRVFHGSGAKFDKFDHSHMGEGEGAQAYGWGTYVTEVEGIGRTYAESSSGNIFKSGFGDFYLKKIKEGLAEGKSFEEIKQGLLNYHADVYKKADGNKDMYGDFIHDYEKLKSLKEEELPNRNLYTVEIPDDNGSNYLHWGEAVPSDVINSIKQRLFDELVKGEYEGAEKELKRELDNVFKPSNSDGKLVYGTVSSYLGSDKAASEFLNDMGFVGISYPAQATTGGRKDGARNYVIFNEADAQIVDHVQFLRTEDGTVYGWAVNGKIYLTPDGMNPNTPAHEYTHLWAAMVEKNDPKLWNRIVEAMKESPTWNEVLLDEAYSDIHNNDSRMASEVLSRLSGEENYRRAMERAEQEIKAADGIIEKAKKIALWGRIKQALADFWTSVKSVFGLTDKMPWTEFVNMALGDLYAGVNPNAEGSPLERMKELAEQEAKYAEMDATVDTAANLSNTDEDDDTLYRSDDTMYRIREEAAPKNTGIGYKVFVLKNGELYPPMVANPNGEATPVGVWLDADAAPVAGQSKTGRSQVKAGGKGTQGGSGKLAYRPGWHLGEIPYALQFNRNDENGERTLFPANFVWAEVEYANDVDYQEEAMSYGYNQNGKFQHSYAGLPRVPENGAYHYRTNPNPDTDPWIITGAMRVKRLLTPTEVDEMVKATGREPQRRQEGAITDEQINALNAEIANDYREGDGAYTDDELALESDPVSKALGKPRGTRKQRNMFAQRERKRMRDAVEQVAGALNTPIVLLDSTEGLAGKRATAKGWYEKSTGRIVVVLPNNRSVADVMQTVLHEAVAHYGLRKLFGSGFDNFIDNIYNNVDAETRQKINLLASRNGWNLKVATEEYLASLAEDANFERVNPYIWRRIKSFFLDMLAKAGIRLDIELTDDELRYILWRSYQNLKYPGKYRTIVDEARDIAKQGELKVGNYAENVRADVNVAEESDAEYDRATKVAERFNARHKGAAPVVVMKNDKPIEEQLLEIGFSQKEIDFITARYKKGANAFFNVERNIVVLLRSNLDNKQTKTILWHEAVHKVIREMGITHEQLNNFFELENEEEKVSAKEVLRNAGYEEELFAEEYLAYYIQELYWNGQLNSSDYNILSRLNDKATENNRKQIEFVQPIINSIVNGTFGFHKQGDETGERRGTEQRSESRNNKFDGGRGTIDRLSLYNSAINEDTGEGIEDDVLFRSDSELAIENYNKRVLESSYQAQEALQDSMLALKEAQEAIVKETGKVIRDEENAYMAENALSSVNTAEAAEYKRAFYEPLVDAVSTVGKKMGYTETYNYLMAKHGIERNREMSVKEALKDKGVVDKAKYNSWKSERDNTRAEARAKGLSWEDTQRELDKLAETFGAKINDYSGLSAMFGDGFTEKAYTAVKSFEESVDTRELNARVRAASKATLMKLYNSSILDEETFGDINSMYEYYVPLRGFEEKTAEDVYAYLSQETGRVGSVMKIARGRNSKAENPIAFIGQMAEQAIAQGNRNRVKLRFLNFALSHMTSLLTVTRNVYLEKIGDDWVVKTPKQVIKENMTPQEMAEAVQAWEKDMNEKIKESPKAYKKVDAREQIPYKMPNKENLSEHQVYVKRAGKLFVITVNGSPRLAQALNGLTNPDQESGLIMNAINKVNRTLSTVYTTRNINFVASNIARDLVYTNSMVWVKESPEYARKFNANCAKVLKDMYSLFSKLEKGTLNMSDPTEKFFAEFIRNGGETGYTQIKDIEAKKKELKKALAKTERKGVVGFKTAPIGKTRDGLEAVDVWLDHLNRSMENIARFAAYKTSREMGRSVSKSIWDAKEISVNFNKKGAGGKFLNANGQTLIGSLAAGASGLGRGSFVFWNAGIQGMYNIYSGAKKNPKKALGTAATLATLGVLVSLFAGDDDEYMQLPEHIRRNNLCFKLPWMDKDSWITIPLPIEYRAIYGVFEYMSNIATGKEELDGLKIAGLFTQLLPIDMLEGGGIAEGDFITPFMPSALAPLWQARENKSWTGLPIWRDSPFDPEFKPEFQRVYKGTSPYIVDFTKKLNQLGGGDDVKAGWRWLDWNPAIIEHVAEGYLGGYATMARQAMNIFSGMEYLYDSAVGNEPDENYKFDPKDIPMLSRLWKYADRERASSGVVNKFFENKKNFENTADLLRDYSKQSFNPMVTPEEREYAMERIVEIQKSDEFKEYMIFKGFKKTLDDAYKRTKENDTPENRKMYNDLMKMVNEAIEVSVE